MFGERVADGRLAGWVMSMTRRARLTPITLPGRPDMIDTNFVVSLVARLLEDEKKPKSKDTDAHIAPSYQILEMRTRYQRLARRHQSSEP